MYHEIRNSDFMEYPMVHCVRGKKKQISRVAGMQESQGKFQRCNFLVSDIKDDAKAVIDLCA